MVVRFRPDDPGDAASRVGSDRADLAEIIDLRCRLGGAAADPAGDAATEPARDARSEPVGDAAADRADGPAGRAARDADGAARATGAGHASDCAADMSPSTAGAEPAAARAEQRWAARLRAAEPEFSAPDGGREVPVTDTDAYAQAVKILGRKQLSEAELRRELLSREHDAPDVEAVIAEFHERLYLDDAALARGLCESLRDRKHASRAEIARKLSQRGISRSIVDAVVAEIDADSERELLEEAAHSRARRLLGLERETAERRLLSFLARRGWQGESARRIAREALEAAGVGASRVRFR